MIAKYYVDAHGAQLTLQQSKAQLPAHLAGYVNKMTNTLLENLRKEAPKRTGKFAQGLRSRSVGVISPTRVEMAVVAGGEHGFVAPYLMYGTRPHMITSSKPMPMCYESGVVAFAHTVNHPGTKPHPFVDNAVSTTNAVMANETRKMLRKLPMIRFSGKSVSLSSLISGAQQVANELE